LAQAREAGARLAFITNNAARPARVVADHLVELGVEATPDDVVTSSQAAAQVLLARLGPGARVAALGDRGLFEALDEAGLIVVALDDESAVAIVDGYGPEVAWRDIMRAAVRIRDGLWWVATNTDMSIPTPYGTAPGNGVLVELLQRFSGVTPVVAGKPDRPLIDETVRRTAATSPLMVGDRLDTDILGGFNAGVDTLLVLTGVTGLAELVAAEPDERPTYIAADLGGLATIHAAPEIVDGAVHAGGWFASVSDGRLSLSGSGLLDDWWRAAAVAAWAWRDTHGSDVDIDGVVPPAVGSLLP
jgi:HAD superfamily hydrolase (TIGR01450 family)